MSFRRLFLVFVLATALESTGGAQVHTFTWVNLQGNTLGGATYAIAADGQGNSYFTGTFSGIVNFGGVTLSAHGVNDVVIGKYSRMGTLLWAAQIQSVNRAQPSAIGVDKSGNVYVTGVLADSISYGITPPLTLRLFIAKFDPTGHLVWNITTQNASTISANGIAVSPSGRSLYVTANSRGAILMDMDSAVYPIPLGMHTMRLDTNGSIRWIRTDTATARSLCLDSAENIYIGGSYVTSATIAGISIKPSKNNQAFGFAASYDSAGNSRWAMALDSIGPGTLCYSYGYIFGGNGPTVMAARISSDGAAVKYLRNAGTVLGVSSIAADVIGNIYLVGRLTTNLVIDTVRSHGGTFYILKLDTALRARWVTSWYDAQNAGGIFAPSLTVDTSQGLFIAGDIRGLSYFDGMKMTPKASENGFVAELTVQDLSFSLPDEVTLCPGDSVPVAIRVDGDLFLSNTYDVQLSDSLGRFAAPTHIGFRNGTGSCIIMAAIPPKLHSGSKYRIRVMATSPAIVTADNGFNLAVFPAPTATITPSGAIDLCETDSLKLTVSGGVGCRWSTGDTTRSIVVHATGFYTATTFGANGCSAIAAAARVTSRAAPPVPAVTRAGNTLYSSSPANNQWNRNGIAIPGATQSSYIVTRSGTYTVTVSSAYQCSSISDDFVITFEGVSPGSKSGQVASIDASGNIQLNSAAGSHVVVSLCDVLGIECFKVERTVAEPRASIPISEALRSQPNGVYYIRVQTESGIVILKYIHLR
ncbi:MAG: hypothetical protein Q8922_11565 [Bacteroidota bacterium]|nr:hypothetical protein [Bacteroidota bacterium]MDP4234681.1 hypothetical protein [Bacteroidota bacterium]MDP4243845.1 hypothetical protein [Bacteroidota bacterium]MDP4288563.1 hypothetical protein [Bacteroidota bacterium]